MAPDKLAPSDPRAADHTATIRGKTYHYRLAVPSGGRSPTGTIILIHGFPDLGFGWRYQVPFLAEQLGLQVIVPDLLGYGGTDAPDEIAPYAHKSVCADLVALVDHVGIAAGSYSDNKFFVGGHDWGGHLAWRMAVWHPDRLRGVFSVCTPFAPPSSKPFIDLDTVTKHIFPQFGYQRQFASEDLVVDTAAGGPPRIRKLLSALYGGRLEQGQGQGAGSSRSVFDPTRGIALEHLDGVQPPALLSPAELDYYVAEYARHGLRGPTNWYRTRRLNYDDEQVLFAAGNEHIAKVAVPALMVCAADDSVLLPAMAAGMDPLFEQLTRVTVPGTHWALWQSSEQINEQLRAFLAPLLSAAKASI